MTKAELEAEIAELKAEVRRQSKRADENYHLYKSTVRLLEACKSDLHHLKTSVRETVLEAVRKADR